MCYHQNIYGKEIYGYVWGTIQPNSSGYLSLVYNQYHLDEADITEITGIKVDVTGKYLTQDLMHFVELFDATLELVP